MFEIVNDVSLYPEFLPWCTGVEIIEQNAREVVAALSMKVKGVTETFTTRNVLTPGEAIELQLVSGPFKELSGRWIFTRLGDDDGCKVELHLNFKFSPMRSLLGGLAFSRVLTSAADQMVDAFCTRANSLLG